MNKLTEYLPPKKDQKLVNFSGRITKEKRIEIKKKMKKLKIKSLQNLIDAMIDSFLEEK